MNKDQEVLETKFKADAVQNVITKDGTVYNSVLSAMEQQAVEFAKYLKTAPSRKVKAVNAGGIHYHVFTIEEHYQNFNQQNNGNKQQAK